MVAQHPVEVRSGRPAGPPCEACGRRLDRAAAAVGRFCRTLSCQTVSAVRHEAERRRLEAERDMAALRAYHAASDVAHVVLIPFAQRPLVPLPAERRAAFEATLRAAFAAAADLADVSADPPPPAASDPRLEAGCAACRGRCCGLGGDHAFLWAPHLAALLARDRGWSPASLFAHYIGRLPAISSQGACVFQGERGCVLDRGVRADICNEYRCESLARLAELAGQGPVGIGASDDGTIVHAAVIGAGDLPAAAGRV